MRQEKDGEQRLVQLVQTTGAFDLAAVCQSVDERQLQMAGGGRAEFPLARRFGQLLEQYARENIADTAPSAGI